ncbi:mitogen-activated protein kinase kinase kinase 20-like [Gastrolobium bilobum]|uniref:mitogen-activated protein kinase kinase kinase 20-like n=1 Tax=Gastrolobium bilobum TaxID=150636 RepID=UPI002AAFBEA0|nr:mitogen-activated protein kinase kinase kinase 20-like [Gastrolobium bilobum]
MDWVRGNTLGRGSFATVNLAIPTNRSTQFSSPTAVKSSSSDDVFASYLLKNEKEILDHLGYCPHIVKCYGHDYTFENGGEYYNLFLEYAAGGTLADQLKNHGGGFPESRVRRYTRSIIEGLNHIHAKGFVHCDIKLQNILVFVDNDTIKIADFGLAKETGKEEQSQTTTWAGDECRGTPMFMSPESLNNNECESPADIWALGCAVVEMVTGKPAWNVGSGSNDIWQLLFRIGVGEELPHVPDELSQQGKDFLGKCFVRDPKKRWTAEMLLKHPFVVVADDDDDDDIVPTFKHVHPSPRSNFDFPHCPFTTGSSSCLPSLCSPADRLRRLVTDQRPIGWSETDGWTSVRGGY